MWGRKQAGRLGGYPNPEAAAEHAALAERIQGLQEERVDETERALARAAVQFSGAARRDWTELVEHGGIGTRSFVFGVGRSSRLQRVSRVRLGGRIRLSCGTRLWGGGRWVRGHHVRRRRLLPVFLRLR